ncbi:MAG: hypothetical protein D6722_24685 [Bacteroidetes bacterium]|nr:MAG: hypothetical protein D6722_24685 [Bacteroidota bacterium]
MTPNLDELMRISVTRHAKYPNFRSGNIVYPALGLAGESGEVVEIVKKALRRANSSEYGCAANILTNDERSRLTLEIGDVLWYVEALCRELGITPHQAMQATLAKLDERHKEASE